MRAIKTERTESKDQAGFRILRHNRPFPYGKNGFTDKATEYVQYRKTDGTYTLSKSRIVLGNFKSYEQCKD